MRRTIVALLGALIVNTAYSLPPPRAAVSEYLRSTGAGFAMSPEEGVRYGMNFALLKAVESPIYLTVVFENPEKEAASLRKDVLLPVVQKTWQCNQIS